MGNDIRKVKRYIGLDSRKNISTKTSLQVYNMCNGECFYCHKNIGEHEKRKDRWEVDHYIARKEGGRDEIENYVVACHTCNRSKGKKITYVFCKEHNHYPKCRRIVENKFCKNKVQVVGGMYCYNHDTFTCLG